jgi:ATP-binding cassette subfamily B protein
VRDADEIIVLDGGRVAERGSYAELKGRGGRFSELVATESVDTADV